jgi:hypothetical protein
MKKGDAAAFFGAGWRASRRQNLSRRQSTAKTDIGGNFCRALAPQHETVLPTTANLGLSIALISLILVGAPNLVVTRNQFS